MRRAFAVSVFLSAAAAAAQDSAPPTSDLVTAHRGELPVILSAPHGGIEPIPGVPERKGEGLAKGPSGFFTGRDVGTDRLAQEIAAAVAAGAGRKPYLVVARFHRKYIDANRPPEIGLEDPRARPVYDAYHGTLAHYCREVQKTFGRGLLLDVHGQGSARDTIFRGTNNGKTVTLLVQRFGEAAHNGPKSFFGLLAANCVKTHPRDGGREQSGFTGGHIVKTYGSHGAHGIDAIQLECGADYTNRDKVRDAAAGIAAAVEEYRKLYLPAEPVGKK